MIFSYKIRNVAFWASDSLKGKPVKKHFEEVSFIQKNFDSAKAIKIRKNHLQNLLNHASRTTPFYKNYSSKKLKDYPIIDKNIIRINKQEFLSEKFKNKNNKSISTSGSTGVSLQVFQDHNKINRSKAENIYFYEQVDFKVGYRLFYIRIWWGRVSNILIKLKNICLFEVRNFNKKGYLDSLISKIESYNGSSGIIGYASSLEQICQYLDNTNSKPIKSDKIKAILAISEPLFPHTKIRMSNYFNSKVFSRYSNSENGILAQQTLESNDAFEMNWSSYYFELLELESNKPSKSGDLGRIVVTDLFNYVMPIIRYDTGDIGEIDYSVSPPVLKKIEGRRSDIIYNTSGEIVSPMIIVRCSLSEGVIQSQLIQEGGNFYILKLNVTQNFNDVDKILEEFKTILGNDAVIKINFVDDIPVLRSGKRRATVNNYCN